jgi:nitrate reductase gamma subunit
MSPEVVLGFTIIGGLLVGYITGRQGPNKAVLFLWGLAAVYCVFWAGLLLWADDEWGLGGVYFTYLVIVPFAGSAVVAGIAGLLARKVANRTEL